MHVRVSKQDLNNWFVTSSTQVKKCTFPQKLGLLFFFFQTKFRLFILTGLSPQVVFL
jgi:hypothetical protein